jgi:nitroimidazol reductase NimA-like FMN-containing flavoprotein (pyridoxamine 5'-phosphate oxidase superfamily)
MWLFEQFVYKPRNGGFMFIQLSAEEAESLLSESHIGHMGCITERGPYVVPVHYIFHDGNLYMHSRVGEKIRALRENLRVCLQVEKVEDVYHWRSAIAFGKYEEITSADERAWFNRRILVRFPHLTPVESFPTDSQNDVVIFRIRVEEITGIREG